MLKNAAFSFLSVIMKYALYTHCPRLMFILVMSVILTIVSGPFMKLRMSLWTSVCMLDQSFGATWDCQPKELHYPGHVDRIIIIIIIIINLFLIVYFSITIYPPYTLFYSTHSHLPCNHHTVVHESFFFFAWSFHLLTPHTLNCQPVL